MKKIILIIIPIIIASNSFAGCRLYCKVKYYYEVKHQEDPIIQEGYSGNGFNAPTIASGGVMPYAKSHYEESATYSVMVGFYSGYELNEYFGANYYHNNSIIATINWDSGGSSYILLEKWITKLKYIDENEMKYDPYGHRIYDVSGYDNNNLFWKIHII